MIPTAIDDARREHGWDVSLFSDSKWFTLSRGELLVQGSRDRWRHTTARAYRGNALTAILRNQREVVGFLAGL